MSLMQDDRKIPKKYYLLLVMVILSMMLYPLTNRPIGVVRDLTLPWETNIPFIREFVVIYHVSYPLMFVNLILFLIRYRDVFVKSTIAIALGNVLGFFTYLLYQTEVPRPEALGNDLFSRLLRMTYSVDNPYNGFPSLHLSSTTIILIAVLSSKCHKGYKIFSIVLSTLILLSTLFIKQHTLLDVFGGVVYGALSYLVVAYGLNLKSKNGNFRSGK